MFLLFIQKQGKCNLWYDFYRIPLAPIFRFWNLRIEGRAILADILPLFLSDLLCNFVVALGFGIIQHIKINGIPFSLCLRKNAVFLF